MINDDINMINHDQTLSIMINNDPTKSKYSMHHISTIRSEKGLGTLHDLKQFGNGKSSIVGTTKDQRISHPH